MQQRGPSCFEVGLCCGSDSSTSYPPRKFGQGNSRPGLNIRPSLLRNPPCRDLSAPFRDQFGDRGPLAPGYKALVYPSVVVGADS
jgi:hypothetical protein